MITKPISKGADNRQTPPVGQPAQPLPKHGKNRTYDRGSDIAAKAKAHDFFIFSIALLNIFSTFSPITVDPSCARVGALSACNT